MQTNTVNLHIAKPRSSTTINAHLMGQHHRSHIISLLRSTEPVSRAEIARTLGLAPSVITQQVKDLLTEGCIVEEGSGKASVGRRPSLLRLNPDFRTAIGLYIRRQKLVGGLVNLAGKIITRFKMSLDELPNAKTAVQQLASMVSGLRQENTLGICVTISGLIDVEAGKEVFSPVLDWHDISLKDPLQQAVGLPVYVENNANAFALAEYIYGAARPYRDSLCVIVGEGLGAGVIMNGRLHRGAFGSAGELGHARVDFDEDAPICRCGERGCLEEFCSKRALDAGARRLGYADIDALADAARAGDDSAQAVFDHFGTVLGYGLKNAVNILGSEAVVLVDDLMKYGDLFFDTTARIIREHSFGSSPVVLQGELGEDGFLVGAAEVVLTDFLKSPIIGTSPITNSGFQTPCT